MAAHLEPAYQAVETGALPITETLTRDSLILPLHHALSADDQEYIVDVLRGIARA
jgi:perosamine synthetase